MNIHYELSYKDVKNINLRIKPNGDIFVSANKIVPADKVDDFVISKSNYIFNVLEKFKESNKYAEKPKQYISGESFKLLGRDLRLKVSHGEVEDVYSDGIYLFLTTKDTNNLEKKRNTINKWFNNQCNLVFNEIATNVFSKFEKYGAPLPTIKIRNMKSRWGSCQPTKGIITLNSKLIESPRFCIEYVVLHEFCHFIHPNHSKKFYSFMTMMMPDWKERKNNLEHNLAY